MPLAITVLLWWGVFVTRLSNECDVVIVGMQAEYLPNKKPHIALCLFAQRNKET